MKIYQKVLDHLGPEMCEVMRWASYFVVAYTWLCALLAPLAEYAYVGPWKFYKMWQKLIFSTGCAAGGYGLFRFTRTWRTSREKANAAMRVWA
jgi:hypothetical protein